MAPQMLILRCCHLTWTGIPFKDKFTKFFIFKGDLALKWMNQITWHCSKWRSRDQLISSSENKSHYMTNTCNVASKFTKFFIFKGDLALKWMNQITWHCSKWRSRDQLISSSENKSHYMTNTCNVASKIWFFSLSFFFFFFCFFFALALHPESWYGSQNMPLKLPTGH